MRSIVLGVCIAFPAVAVMWVETTGQTKKPVMESSSAITPAAAIERGARWLASVQGADGGWGQDGGDTSSVRSGERPETNGNDVANTAVAALALFRAEKQYQSNVERALAFILKRVEASPAVGLEITDVQGTQIQRKLGPYIDTFLTSMLLAEVDGTRSNPALNARVRQALQKTVAKIENNQQRDGSWNIAGGWAPVLGTSLASRSLFQAKLKGVQVQDRVMKRAEDYTIQAFNSSEVRGVASAEAAGVPLYQSAQALEQLSRTDADRSKNAREIDAIHQQLARASFVDGFGSIGGEEFFAYLNVGDALKRAGGEEWKKWHSETTQKIVRLQNNDGTWAGHHCITGRVAVTSAAILNLSVDRAK
jgi:hypothetical protein